MTSPRRAGHDGPVTAPSPARWTLGALAAVALAVPGVARARGSKLPPGGNRCVDSFGTVIDGVTSPRDCQKLGARWAKPGSKSLPKDAPASKKRRRMASGSQG